MNSLAIGSKVGKWTVLSLPQKREGRWVLLCRCECGREKYVRRSEDSQSCARCNKGNKIHGQSGAPLYRAWINMIIRCEDPSSLSKYAWSNYGGRGIKVCDEWHKFLPFMKWAMANGYREGLEIDRRDNNGIWRNENDTSMEPGQTMHC